MDNKDKEEEYEDQKPKAKGKGRKSGKEKGVFTGFQCTNKLNCNKDITLMQGEHENLKWKFLLDMGSTIQATIMNPDLATNIKPSDRPMIMWMNAGMRKLTVDAYVEGIRVAKYDPQQITNIFGFSHMVDKYRVAYDSNLEDAFFAHTNNKVIKFAQGSD